MEKGYTGERLPHFEQISTQEVLTLPPMMLLALLDRFGTE